MGENDAGRAMRNKYTMHAAPLPVKICPLPAIVPHNPLSWIRIIYVLLAESLGSYKQNADELDKFKHVHSHGRRHVGYIDPLVDGVHVTDEDSIRSLWESGFFGKGNLSRSEPEWNRKHTGIEPKQAKTAADVTNARRLERRRAKLERATREIEIIENILEEERQPKSVLRKDSDQSIDRPAFSSQSVASQIEAKTVVQDEQAEIIANGSPRGTVDADKRTGATACDSDQITQKEESTRQVFVAQETRQFKKEHLQLTTDEALFLHYGLGVLNVYDVRDKRKLLTRDLFVRLVLNKIPSTISREPTTLASVDPDEPAILSYVAYHHFRSLGWVVRPGMKFAVDFLLYARGPVFAHAQFAVLVLPSYTSPYWLATDAKRHEVAAKSRRDWWSVHCTNRVQSQVLKSLVLCYVDIPEPMVLGSATADPSIGQMLTRYKVKDFVIRRWTPQRNLK